MIFSLFLLLFSANMDHPVTSSKGGKLIPLHRSEIHHQNQRFSQLDSMGQVVHRVLHFPYDQLEVYLQTAILQIDSRQKRH